MREVFKCLAAGKKIINSSFPEYAYICLYTDNVLYGATIDNDGKEHVDILQGNYYLINNPECYTEYFPYSIGDILLLKSLNITVKIVAFTGSNVYFEKAYFDDTYNASEIEDIVYVLKRSDFLSAQ